MKDTKSQRINELVQQYFKAQQNYDFSVDEIKKEAKQVGLSWITFRLIARHKFFQIGRGN